MSLYRHFWWERWWSVLPRWRYNGPLTVCPRKHIHFFWQLSGTKSARNNEVSSSSRISVGSKIWKNSASYRRLVRSRVYLSWNLMNVLVNGVLRAKKSLFVQHELFDNISPSPLQVEGQNGNGKKTERPKSMHNYSVFVYLMRVVPRQVLYIHLLQTLPCAHSPSSFIFPVILGLETKVTESHKSSFDNIWSWKYSAMFILNHSNGWWQWPCFYIVARGECRV